MTAPPSPLSAGTTLTPPRPANHPAAGGTPGPRPSRPHPGQIVQRTPYVAVSAIARSSSCS